MVCRQCGDGWSDRFQFCAATPRWHTESDRQGIRRSGRSIRYIRWQMRTFADSVSVFVTNVPPELGVLAAKQVNEGNDFAFAESALDVSSDTLSYNWFIDLNADGDYLDEHESGQGRTITWSTLARAVGTSLQVGLQATDKDGGKSPYAKQRFPYLTWLPKPMPVGPIRLWLVRAL